MRSAIPILMSVLIALAACTSAQEDQPAKPAPKPDSRPTTRPVKPKLYPLTAGKIAIEVRVAETPKARGRGLQGVKSLPRNQGMIFGYPKDLQISFWMKGCVMSLDIAFLDAKGKIKNVVSLDPPKKGVAEVDLPRARSEGLARYVLEMEKGWFKRNGIGVGSVVKIPKDNPVLAAK